MHIADTISTYNKKGYILNTIRILKTGKEANVYLIESRGQLLILKVYREDFLKSSNSKYIEGKHFNEKSIAKAVRKKTTLGKTTIKKLWTKREYYLLKKYAKLGIKVPKALAYSQGSVLMQYLGNEDVPAPTIKEVSLNYQLAKKVSHGLIQDIETLWKNGLVHGDLSEYNILWWQNTYWIIDLPQTLDIRNNPNATDAYKRDLRNIKRYFHMYYGIE